MNLLIEMTFENPWICIAERMRASSLAKKNILRKREREREKDVPKYVYTHVLRQT